MVTIGELDFSIGDSIQKQPGVKVVEHYWWTGKKHTELYPQLVDILKNVWHCRRVVVDATGVGQPVSSFLRQSLGSPVIPFTFTQQSKSELGFNLLAAINSGRLKMYAGDGSAEYQEFWFEMEKAKSQYRPSQTMNFYVDPAQGHDDFLMSLALLVEAANQYRDHHNGLFPHKPEKGPSDGHHVFPPLCLDDQESSSLGQFHGPLGNFHLIHRFHFLLSLHSLDYPSRSGSTV